MPKVSLKFVPTGPIYNILALAQIMAWGRSNDGLFTDEYMCHLASMSQSKMFLSLPGEDVEDEMVDVVTYEPIAAFMSR